MVEIALAGRDVAAVPGKTAKAVRLAECLRRLSGAEVVPGVAFLCGELRQRQIGVGWAALRDLPDPSVEPVLTVSEVDAAFATIGALAGPGSQVARRTALRELFGRASAVEQTFLRQLLVGELRQGALAGVMVDAVAAAAGLAAPDVRRALLLRGDLRAVAEVALRDGAAGLAGFRLEVGRPLAPMLAQPAEDAAEALRRAGAAACEEKLDGARVQIHRDGTDVAVFTRSLDDITVRVPEVVEAALALPVSRAVLDGEAIALGPGGRPRPFQVTASRIGSTADVAKARAAVPLSVVLFDTLHVDGADLLDSPASDRFAALAAAVPAALLVRRVTVPADGVPAAEAFLAETLRRGHEGLVVKALAAPYAAGRRGGGWWKVKPRYTLDLLAGAAGGYVMLGKTFKGLTDAMLTWQTERLLALEATRDAYTVYVRPELIVEIAFDGVQNSPRYPGGVALRFARVKGYRADKRVDEADTLAAVLALRPQD